MLNSVWVAIPISVILGFLSGIGTGGGSLLIVWLTAVLNMSPQDARSINLMFFIPSALVACAFRWKKGKLKISKLLPAIISGCIGAIIGSGLSGNMDLRILKKLFGCLLIVTGIRELLYKRKAGQ